MRRSTLCNLHLNGNSYVWTRQTHLYTPTMYMYTNCMANKVIADKRDSIRPHTEYITHTDQINKTYMYSTQIRHTNSYNHESEGHFY